MHHPQAPTPRSLLKVALCVVAAAVTLGLLPSSAGAALPALERFPTYHAQTRCSPNPKPGTVELAKYLMRRYKGSGSLGISRGCGAGGVSEHKEGRAFDWALNASSRRDRHYAANFLHRLRKRDRHGRRDALARRMGIMYVIWNDHIYSATYHYAKHRYRNAGCKRIRGCSKTLRHRDHMHISLTRKAARGKTSWYENHGAGHKKHKAKAKHKVRHHKAKARHHKKARHHEVRHHRAKARHHEARHHRAKARHHHARHHRARHHRHRHHVRHHHARHHRARHHRHRHHVRHHHARHHRARHRHRAAHRGRVTTKRASSTAAPSYGGRQWASTAAGEDWMNVGNWSEDQVDLPEGR